jgi:cysteine synthase B
MKISDLVGNTPLVELRRICPNPRVRLLAKMESHNPGGSVKDRPALSMIEGAEARGELRPGVRLIEPTSGNTGIALAMIACAKGYELELVMPENSTAERVWTMRAFGAKVTLTPAEGSMEAAIDYAREKVARGEAIMLDQFSNPDNWRAHYRGTGPELWRDTRGTLTHFVSSMGTTGTIMGVSRFLKEQSPAPTIIGAQPADGAKIPGIRRWPQEYLPKIYEPARVDRIVDVTQRDAEETTRRLAREEGVFCGMSAGGATWVALQIAREIDEGVVAVIICDRGDRYLSSDLFRQEAP